MGPILSGALCMLTLILGPELLSPHHGVNHSSMECFTPNFPYPLWTQCPRTFSNLRVLPGVRSRLERGQKRESYPFLKWTQRTKCESNYIKGRAFVGLQVHISSWGSLFLSLSCLQAYHISLQLLDLCWSSGCEKGFLLITGGLCPCVAKGSTCFQPKSALTTNQNICKPCYFC